MYGKYMPKKPRDMHFDILFDYEGRAEAVRKAEDANHQLWALEPRPSDFVVRHTKIIKAFKTALANAYPPGFWEDFERLRHQDLTGLPITVEFLEADPWFFRSGYVKQKLIRYINKFTLSANYVIRLQKVVLAAVDKCYRREFRDYCRLARKVDSPELRHGLQQRLQNHDSDIRRRAQWMLDGLEWGVPRKGKHWEMMIPRRQRRLSPQFLENIEYLRLGQSRSLEWAFMLLIERDLGMLGYEGKVKGKLIEALTELDLSTAYKPSQSVEYDLPIDFKPPLQKIVLSVVDTWYVYEFKSYCRLAPQLDSSEFRQELTQRLEHTDYHVRRRARLVLDALPPQPMSRPLPIS